MDHLNEASTKKFYVFRMSWLVLYTFWTTLFLFKKSFLGTSLKGSRPKKTYILFSIKKIYFPLKKNYISLADKDFVPPPLFEDMSAKNVSFFSGRLS